MSESHRQYMDTNNTRYTTNYLCFGNVYVCNYVTTYGRFVTFGVGAPIYFIRQSFKLENFHSPPSVDNVIAGKYFRKLIWGLRLWNISYWRLKICDSTVVFDGLKFLFPSHFFSEESWEWELKGVRIENIHANCRSPHSAKIVFATAWLACYVTPWAYRFVSTQKRTDRIRPGARITDTDWASKWCNRWWCISCSLLDVAADISCAFLLPLWLWLPLIQGDLCPFHTILTVQLSNRSIREYFEK